MKEVNVLCRLVEQLCRLLSHELKWRVGLKVVYDVLLSAVRHGNFHFFGSLLGAGGRVDGGYDARTFNVLLVEC